ncbi:hypothetical protein RFI_16670 [Reticulomyxa filosa]|uniref:EamA domain-containing protein n=1 Tax=Reticulomyxa filosa TaxID=46433 RepID=X6N467_RETFI|nr:hypothetical protein RFI_16670 [Reticulomyxa filosa]|eukprot:ETO20544.1 hypothetical protein RFI_16670 [Reticulomyxa filosa]
MHKGFMCTFSFIKKTNTKKFLFYLTADRHRLINCVKPSLCLFHFIKALKFKSSHQIHCAKILEKWKQNASILLFLCICTSGTFSKKKRNIKTKKQIKMEDLPEEADDSPKKLEVSLVKVYVGWQGLSALLSCISILSQLLTNEFRICVQEERRQKKNFVYKVNWDWDGKRMEVPYANKFANVCICVDDMHLVKKKIDSEPILMPTLASTNIKEIEEPTKSKEINWWMYAIASAADVGGNTLVLWSFQYTNITSVTLLDFFTIPVVFVISYFLWKNRNFSKWQYLSVTSCLAGMILLTYSDAIGSGGDSNGKDPFLGDMLVLSGATCYAISNIFGEYAVSKIGIFNYLWFIGVKRCMYTCLYLYV